MNKKKTVIVLGPPRSGTSLTSFVLNVFGVNMGNVKDSVKSNPRGDWEDIDFMALNKEIISSTGKEVGLEIPSIEEVLSLKDKFSKKIVEIIKNKSKNNLMWGWKDPHTSVTIDLFIPYLENPYLVAVDRTREDTIKSYLKLLGEKIKRERAEKYIDRYNQRVKDTLAKNRRIPSCVVSFDNLINNPEEECLKLSSFLGIKPTKENLEKIKDFIIPRDKIENEKRKAKRKRWFFRHLPKAIWRKIFG